MRNYTIPFSPVLPMNGLRKEIDRLFDDVFVTGNGAGWRPAADVREGRDNFTFEFDVPGVTPESLDVVMEDGMLSVRGERASRELMEGERHLAGERITGRFERRFRLPKTADSASITASYAHGVLTVRVQKIAPAQPRRVAVTIDQQLPATSDQTSA